MRDRLAATRSARTPHARCVGTLLVALLLATGAVTAQALDYPLAVSPDGRRIVDANGEAVYFNTDSPWNILTRVDRDGALAYLDDRQAREFNALVLTFLVSAGSSSGSTANVYGDHPFLVEGDFGTPNEAYFAHVDWFLQEAHARGFTVFANPAYIGYACSIEGFCVEMKANGVTKMRDYGRWIGARYRDQPNLVWVHGGDANAGNYNAMDVVDAVAYGVRDEDPYHLHTAHCHRFTLGSDCYDRPWLDVDTSYAECAETAAFVKAGYENLPTRPVFYIEGRYENQPGWTGVCLRSQAYWVLLGGSAGHSYGNQRIWDFGLDWQNNLDSVGSRSMQLYEELARHRQGALLEPDFAHTVLVAGYGDVNTSGYAPCARTPGGRSILVYVPTARELTVDLDQLSGDTAEAWWLSPSDGTAIALGSFPSTGTRAFTPPAGLDFVLLIDDVAAPLANFWETPTTAPVAHAWVDLLVPNRGLVSGSADLRFVATSGTSATVRLFDLRGRVVATLFDGVASGAMQSLTMDASTIGAGLYFARLRSGSDEVVRRVIVVE